MSLSVLSYGSAAIAYALLTVILLWSRETVTQGQRVLFAVGGTALWGFSIVAGLVLLRNPSIEFTVVPDALRAFLWILCLTAALPGQATWRSVRGVILLVGGALTAVTVVTPFVTRSEEHLQLMLLALSILGCVAIEQIFRNSTAEQKRVLNPFIWTMAGMLMYDLFVFSDAVLFNGVDPALWVPRGAIAAVAVPFFVLSAKRHPDWAETLFVSRELVFYSATLTGVGLYLIAMAVGGFIIRERGGEWGAAIQLGYLVAALAVLGYVLSSARLRARLRVFISKHFYRNRYDYREEWLRLIRTLTDSKQPLPLDQRSIKALCEIVESNRGQLWLDRSSRSTYEPFGSWQAPFPVGEYSAGSALVKFLKQQQWVIDTREYAVDPEHYQNAFNEAAERLPPNTLIVPLFHQNELLGIAQIECANNFRELNFEDHDLLKTAGRQVAAFLAHDLATEQLTETRQFEAYNKLSAFVLHDLKNVLAQQALLVENAKKFGSRPEFMADVITTVDNGVQRMRRLMRQLQQGVPVAQDQRVELNKVMLKVISARSDHGAPCSFTDCAPLWVRAQTDQLTSVVTHVVENAQDATPAGGSVAVRLDEAPDGKAVIEVRDSGIGMSEEFIRHKLFKPFETTKGSSGMGIGAYQAREIVRGLGGDLTVTSEVGRGTVVRIVLPVA